MKINCGASNSKRKILKFLKLFGSIRALEPLPAPANKRARNFKFRTDRALKFEIEFSVEFYRKTATGRNFARQQSPCCLKFTPLRG